MSASYTLSSFSNGLLLNSQGAGITAGLQDGPAALALGGGRFAAAWVSNSGGSGESIQFGIFNAATRALVPATLTDLVGGTANLYGLGMARLSDGNVALAWAEHAAGTTTYWTAVVHGGTGAVLAAPVALASAAIAGGAVSIAAKADGYVVAYSGSETPADSPAFVAGFTNAGAADPGFTTFNAIQRDHGVAELSVAVLANGTIVVVAEGGDGPPGVAFPGDTISGPERGGNVGFRYWNPDGTPLLADGQPVFGDVIGAYVDSRIVTAALPDGNVVIAFDQGNLTTDANKVVVSVRGPQGQYIGGGDTFVLNAEDQLWPSIAVLGDGGFALSWSRRLVASDAPTGTVTIFFRPDGTRAPGDTIQLAATSDTGALLGFADGELVLVAEGGDDGAGAGITAALTRVRESFRGTTGDDVIEGTDLASTIIGDNGADVLNGRGGDDLISGDDSFTVGGNDIITGGEGNDSLSGMAGNDVVFGGNGDDSLDGGNGNDVLRGDAGNDALVGGAGNDLLNGGLGADNMQGGTDNDTYNVDNMGDVVVERAGGGYDRVVSSISYTLGAEVEWLSLAGTANLNGTGNGLANRLDGNAGANTLNGAGGDDTLLGNAGDDTLFGGLGHDWLDGGLGADDMQGGAGDDTYVVDDTGDVILELAGGGDDRVLASITYALGAEMERLSLTGSADLDGTGNALDNRLDGNAGANTLDGGEGQDALRGYAGNDTLIGGGGHDRLDGGLGADRMEGGAGNDTYVVDEQGDVVVELAGEGYDRVRASITYTLGAETERLTLTGTADLDGTGNALDNQLDGNAGANTLDGGEGNDVILGDAGHDTLIGGGGNDRLEGGLGADMLTGGTGADLFRFASAAEAEGDVITDFDVAQGDRIDLRGIDANDILPGDQGFTWLGANPFGVVAGQLRFAGGSLQGDLDGDGAADVQISLTGVASLTAASIWL